MRERESRFPFPALTLKTYNALPALGFNLVIICSVTVVGIWFGTKLDEPTTPWWLPTAYFLWMCGVASGWYQFLRIPFEIKIQDDGLISFRTLFGRIVLSAADIESIRAWGNVVGGGILKVKRKRGSLKILYNMAGLADFVGKVKTLNPTVNVKGSWLNPLL